MGGTYLPPPELPRVRRPLHPAVRLGPGLLRPAKGMEQEPSSRRPSPPSSGSASSTGAGRIGLHTTKGATSRPSSAGAHLSPSASSSRLLHDHSAPAPDPLDLNGGAQISRGTVNHSRILSHMNPLPLLASSPSIRPVRLRLFARRVDSVIPNRVATWTQDPSTRFFRRASARIR